MTHTSKKHFYLSARHLVLFTLGALLSTVPALSQTYSGGLRGTIKDLSGAPVSGASVTLTDEATRQTRSISTDSSGSYAFNALQPSTYTLHITASGFAAADRTHIALATQDFLTLDVQLSVGSATNVVQISADAPLVDNSTASVSIELDQKRLEDVPVLGRNPYITAGLSGLFVNTGNPQFIRFADQNGTTATSVAGGPSRPIFTLLMVFRSPIRITVLSRSQRSNRSRM